MSDPTPERNPVEVLAAEFLDRYRRGDKPRLSEYEARYPGLAAEIREVFPALVLVEEAGAPWASPGPYRGPPFGGGDRVPGRMGDFRIVREIGRGGMGVVYEAFQESLGRTVALKVLPPGAFARPSALSRFRREARSVAALHHSNIVAVFGVGEHDGHHYYAMQFVRGQTLEAVLDDVRRLRRDTPGSPETARTAPETGAALGLLTGRFPAGSTHLDDGRGPAEAHAPADEAAHRGGAGEATVADAARGGSRYYREVARVGFQVAEALAYAHDQGVLHRDIKPSNLLMDRGGTVWVVDFGLAKPDGADELSATGDVVGTIRYMAPERFDGQSHRRGDVYSLGVTLYELLTLRPAFAAADQARLIREVVSSTPAPRSLDRRVPRDLETIVLKAMAREPSARYATAHALARDLSRFLEDRTILARRSTPLERSWRWCRRNPILAALLASVVGLLAYTAVSASVAASRYKAQFERAHLAESLGREKLFSAYLAEARASRFSRRPGRRFVALRALAEAAKIRRTPALRDEAIAALALADLDEVYRSPRPFDGALLAFDPALERYARLDWDGALTVRRVADDVEVRRFPSRGRISGESFLLAFSPDGRHLAVDYALADVHNLTVWDLDRGAPALVDLDPLYCQARFTPDGKAVAFWRTPGTVRIVDLGSGRTVGRWDVGRSITDLAFSPDGRRAALGFRTDDLKVQIRDVPSGRLIRELAESGWCTLAWHPDGKMLALGSSKGKRVYLFDPETGRRAGTLSDQMGQGLVVRFQPVGGLLSAQSWEGNTRVWRPGTGELLLTLRAGYVLDFDRDGSRLATVTTGLGPVIYRIADGHELRTLVREPARRNEGIHRAALHPGGRLLAAAMSDGVGLWDVDRDVAVGSLPTGETSAVLFEPSGDLLVVAERRLMRWRVSAEPGRPGEFRVGPPEFLPAPDVLSVALGGRGRLLAVTRPGGATVLDLDSPGRAIPLGPHGDVRSLAVSPDGRWAATGSHHGGEGVKVWSIPDGRLVKQVQSPGGAASARFSPDGRWLLTNVNRLQVCRLWSVGDWQEGACLDGEGLDFTPDGRLLAVGLADGAVRLVEAQTGRLLASLETPHQARPWDTVFGPDGARLFFASEDSRSVKVWDLRSIRRQLVPMGLDWDWPALPGPEAPQRPAAAALEVDTDLGGHDFAIDQLRPQEVERLNAALEVDPDNVPALLQRARTSELGGRDAEAVADYTRVLSFRPGDFQALLGRAGLHRRRQRNEPCVADYEAAIAVAAASDRAEIQNEAAWIHLVAPPPVRNPARALSHARRAVALAPTAGNHHNTLGIALNRLGRHREAVVALETSLALQPRDATAFDLFFLASSFHHLGEPGRARACYERALRIQLEARLDPRATEDLEAFRAEAEAELGAPRSP